MATTSDAGSGKGRIALSVDVEDWTEVRTLVLSRGRVDWRSELKRNLPKLSRDLFLDTVDRALKVLEDERVRATFFVVGSLAERWPEVVHRIVADGHEIGCHGYFHRCKYDPAADRLLLTPEAFREETLRSRELLRNLSGQDVIGYRAPGGYVSGEMVDILEEMGFRYDSSVSRNDIYRKIEQNVHGVDSFPYRPVRGGLSLGPKDRDFIEFPWSYFTFLDRRMPTAGGPFLRLFGARYIERGIRESLRRGDTGLYFHTIDIARHRMPSPGKARPFYFLIKGDRVERGIRRLLRDFQGQWYAFEDLLPSSKGPPGP